MIINHTSLLVVSDEIMEGLRESIEEKTREADENLEKYCALIIGHHKLEEENEMLRTQISLLNIQLKQSSPSAAVSCLWESHGSPTKPTGRLLIEKTMFKKVAKVQRCLENRGRQRDSHC